MPTVVENGKGGEREPNKEVNGWQKINDNGIEERNDEVGTTEGNEGGTTMVLERRRMRMKCYYPRNRK
jgi:hypothetical protein